MITAASIIFLLAFVALGARPYRVALPLPPCDEVAPMPATIYAGNVEPDYGGPITYISRKDFDIHMAKHRRLPPGKHIRVVGDFEHGDKVACALKRCGYEQVFPRRFYKFDLGGHFGADAHDHRLEICCERDGLRKRVYIPPNGDGSISRWNVPELMTLILQAEGAITRSIERELLN